MQILLALWVLLVVLGVGTASAASPALHRTRSGSSSFAAARPPSSSLPSADWNLRLLRNTAIVEFPRAITFQLDVEHPDEAHGPDPSRTTLVYQPATSSVQARARASVTTDQPGQWHVEFRWRTESSGLPPGVDVRYWWELENGEGQHWVTSPETFTYTDTRYAWRLLERGAVQVHWYAGDDQYGRVLLDEVQSAREWFSQELAIAIHESMRLLAYESISDLQSSMGRGTASWVGGGAYPQYRLILLAISPRATPDRIRRLIRHEVAHLALRTLTGDAYGDPPQWLDEGIAMLAEGEPDPRFAHVLSEAARERTLISLQALSSTFPPDHDAASLSYAQSGAVVRFIKERFGISKLREILAAYRAGASDDEALHGALGVSVDQLDSLWRSEVLDGGPARRTVDATPLQVFERLHLLGGVPAISAAITAVVLITGVGLLLFARRRHR